MSTTLFHYAQIYKKIFPIQNPGSDCCRGLEDWPNQEPLCGKSAPIGRVRKTIQRFLLGFTIASCRASVYEIVTTSRFPVTNGISSFTRKPPADKPPGVYHKGPLKAIKIRPSAADPKPNLHAGACQRKKGKLSSCFSWIVQPS